MQKRGRLERKKLGGRENPKSRPLPEIYKKLKKIFKKKKKEMGHG